MTNPPDLQLTAPPENTPEQCNSALGGFLQTWDQLEIQYLSIFNKILGTHQSVSLVLINSGLNHPTMREILESAGAFRLDLDDQKALSALLRRWKSASTKRNRIVHAHWQLNVKIFPGPDGKKQTKAEWVRFYNPSNPTLMADIVLEKDQALVAAHRFRLKDIAQAGSDVLTLAKDFQAFHERIVPQPFVDPQPIDIGELPLKLRRGGAATDPIITAQFPQFHRSSRKLLRSQIKHRPVTRICHIVTDLVRQVHNAG